MYSACRIAGTFLVVCVAAAQPKRFEEKVPPVPLGWRPVMAKLNHCVARLPADAKDEVIRPLNWMNAQFELAGRSMPPQYREMLNLDVALCELAVQGNRQALQDLAQDLRYKGQDCVEKGWYRTVRVQVETLRDGKTDPGWEVYYLWIPGRNLPNVQRVRFKALSPAEESLPPGLYAFQARKADKSSEETRVAVVSKDAVLCQIPVP